MSNCKVCGGFIPAGPNGSPNQFDLICSNCKRKGYRKETTADTVGEAFTSVASTGVMAVAANHNATQQRYNAIKHMHFEFIENNGGSGMNTITVIDKDSSISGWRIVYFVFYPIGAILHFLFRLGAKKPKSIDIPPLLNFEQYVEENFNGFKTNSYQRDIKKGVLTEEEQLLIKQNQEVINFEETLFKIEVILFLLTVFPALCLIPLGFFEKDFLAMQLLISLSSSLLAVIPAVIYRVKHHRYSKQIKTFQSNSR